MDREKKNSPLMLEMRFENSELPALSAATLEKFVGFVVRQVEFAALSKNSGVSLLGVRDVFQQLEAALMWTGGEVPREDYRGARVCVRRRTPAPAIQYSAHARRAAADGFT